MGEYTATLNDDMNNYTYLKFKYRNSTSNSLEFSVIMEVSEFKNSAFSASHNFLVLGCQNGNNGSTRPVTYTSDTQVSFGYPRRMANSGVDNNAAIPLTISGLK